MTQSHGMTKNDKAKGMTIFKNRIPFSTE